MSNDDIDPVLINIIELLHRNEDKYYSEMLRNILQIKKNNGVEEFLLALNSNDLWGGSGSLCDSALYHRLERVSESDIIFFNAQITKLGEYLLKNSSNSNRRISFWMNPK